MRRKPGTDTEFPAQFAGNWLSVPGFARGICCPFVVPPKPLSTPGGGATGVREVILIP
jgi:hypothetical protein